jgi:hypothetical protein
MFVRPSQSFCSPIACSTRQQLGHVLHPSLLQQSPCTTPPPCRPIRRSGKRQGGSFPDRPEGTVAPLLTSKSSKISSYENMALTPSESALTKSPSHKSRRISTYRREGEGDGPKFPRPPLLQSAGKTVTRRHSGAALRCVNLAALLARAHS